MRLDLHNHHLFTHAGCMDGSGAAILFRHAGGDPKNIHWTPAGHLGEVLAEASVTKNPNIPILIVDVSPESEDVAMFLHDRGNFKVIDHHGSAAQFHGRPGYEVPLQNDACGTELFRRWLVASGMGLFTDKPFERLALMIDDHDRWVLQKPMSIQMPRFFAFTGQQEFIERFMDVRVRFAEEKDYYWNEFEKQMLQLIERAQARRFSKLMDKFIVKPVKFGDREIKIGYIISAEVNCSELLNEYLKLHPEVDLSCQINIDLNKVSLRSIDKADITEFVKPWHGGGHKNAGGHGIPDGLNDFIIHSLHGA